MPGCPMCGKDNPVDFEFCGHCRAPLAGAPERAEERKLVTVLFADIEGSTELGSRLDPERLRSLLQRYFAAMATIIESWGGTVEKYIGDAVMAVFGVPTVRENDAERAVSAAIEMLARIGELNPDFERWHEVTLKARIGVNTGEVIVPAAGHISQLIVAGDTGNVAARLEQASRPGTILVGERTYASARPVFRFEGPISLELKGKTGIVHGYEVLGRRRGMEGARAPSRLTADMVDRDREIASLMEALGRASESNHVQTVLVYGPAGIGKSRLLQEFIDRGTVMEPSPTVYRGRCLATGQGITYWALGEILRSAFGIALGDPSEVAGARLRRGVGEALSHLDIPDDEVRLTTFALATTAGLSLEGNPLDRMEPQDVGEHMARAWPRLVTALAARGPLMLVFEDLHWAGDQLLEMLRRLAARSNGPAVIVATARPDFAHSHPAFGEEIETTSTIWLESLSGAQSEELVVRLLSRAELPSGLRAEILGKAEGNPLFLEEMLGRLIDEGALVRESDRWRAVPGASSGPLPYTVHAVLSARIDALPQEEKRVLQEASVVGRTFWEDPIARGVVSDSVIDGLRALEQKGFLQTQPISSFAGHTEFQFKHALIRDVAYASLPKSRRARAHAEHAAWIEEVAGDRTAEFAELIAHHYAAAAGDADLAWFDEPSEREAIRRKAFDALLVAGTLARRRYAGRRAVELHEHALTFAPSEAGRAAALEALGDDHDAAIHGDPGLTAYRDAIAILRGDPAQDETRGRICMKAARMILARSGAFSTMQEPGVIDELVDEGRACAGDAESLVWLGALWGATAVWWVNAGVDLATLDERVESLSRSLADARAAPFPELEAFAQEYLCEIHMIRGSYGEVAELSRHTDLFDRIPSPAGRSLGLVETAIWAMDVAGEAERALELGMRAYGLAKELSPHDLMHATGFIIPSLFQMGRWHEMDPILAEHVAAFAEETDATCEMLYQGILAGATRLTHCGDLGRARELVAMAPPFDSTDPLWAGSADDWRARFQVAAGDPIGGLRQARAVLASAPSWPRLNAALVILEALAALGDDEELAVFLPTARDLEGGLAVLPPTCDRAEGYVAAAAGDEPTARRLWMRALEGFERLGAPFEAARTRERLAGVSPDAAATALLESALDTYERLGAVPGSERVRAALA